MKIFLKNKKGYSLIEMIVAVSLFSVVFLMIMTIYLSMVDSQRSVIASQNIQESMKFALEVMSKEMRSAQISNDTCNPGCLRDGPAKKVFNKCFAGTDSILYFKDKYGLCVSYFLELDVDGVSRLKVRRGVELFITPNDISVENLDFYVYDDEVDDFHSMQPYVTMRMDTESSGSKEMHKHRTSLQTTISSRYYE